MHPTEKYCERVQQARLDYWREIEGIEPENLIFVDESGVGIGMTRSHGRAEIGRRAHGNKPRQRGKNVSIVGALGLTGILGFFNIMGPYNTLTFEAFIINHLVPKLWKGACVVMDNCSIHKSDAIREAIEKVGAKLIFLPPYSPDFSPIENCWSKAKTNLKKLEPRTYPDLVAALDQSLDAIATEDIRNWFTHCCYCSS
jgi:transposase